MWRDNQGTDLWLYFRWEFGEQPWWLQGTLKQAEALVCLQPCCVKRMLLPWEETMKCPMASMNLILWQRNLLCSSMRGSEKLPKVLISERQMPWFYPHAEGLWWFFSSFQLLLMYSFASPGTPYIALLLWCSPYWIINRFSGVRNGKSFFLKLLFLLQGLSSYSKSGVVKRLW